MDVANAHSLARLIEDFGAIARSIVCHHALGLDTKSFVPGDRHLQADHAALLPPALVDLAEGQAGMVIDADVNELPAYVSGAALAVASPGDAMADTIARAQLLMSMWIISPGWSAHSGPRARRALGLVSGLRP